MCIHMNPIHSKSTTTNIKKGFCEWIFSVDSEDCPLTEMEVPWALRGALLHNLVVPWTRTFFSIGFELSDDFSGFCR